jgi:hypothetical protein
MEAATAAAIVVTERTGDLSASIRREMPGRTAVTIVAQGDGEPPLAFAERVARRIARQDLAEGPSTAVLCCGTRSDDACWRARARIAGALLSAIAERGELIVAARQETGRRSLARFLDLVDQLEPHGCAAGKRVRLRFDGDAQARRGGGRPADTFDTPPPLSLSA